MSVACGDTHTLVATESGDLYSFGRNQNGQLGLGSIQDSLSPQPVLALKVGLARGFAGTSRGAGVSKRYRSMAWRRRTRRSCPHRPPLHAVQGKHVACVAAGAEHSMCVTSEGEVYCWGWGRYGNIGDGESQDRHLPTKAKALEGVQVHQVACGWRHRCAGDGGGGGGGGVRRRRAPGSEHAGGHGPS